MPAYRVQPPPADLAAPLPPLAPLEAGDSRSVLLWVADASHKYGMCVAKHSGLVRAWPAQTFTEALWFSKSITPP